MDIKLFDVKWEVYTAGPSPDCNKRTEVFFFGCDRAVMGAPCDGCFNRDLWDNSVVKRTYTPTEIANQIEAYSPNKYVTIGGGEPLDQIDGLIDLCKALKEKNYHIIIYTWRNLKELIHSASMLGIKARTLLKYVDIVIDGEFKVEQRLYKHDEEDGLLGSIGSGNQVVWDIKSNIGYQMKDLDALALRSDNELIYILKDINQESYTLHE